MEGGTISAISYCRVEDEMIPVSRYAAALSEKKSSNGNPYYLKNHSLFKD